MGKGLHLGREWRAVTIAKELETRWIYEMCEDK